MVMPDGERATEALSKNGRALEFLKEQYRHCKPILLLGTSLRLLDVVGIPAALPSGQPDTGLITGDAGETIDRFIAAIAMHRHFARESEPPVV
jgi:catalase